MKISAENIHNELSRDTYWTRIHIESDNGSRESIVLALASFEYIFDRYHTRLRAEVQVNRWLGEVIKKWEEIGEKVLDDDLHYDVYTNSEEGAINGREFLEKEVTP